MNDKSNKYFIKAIEDIENRASRFSEIFERSSFDKVLQSIASNQSVIDRAMLIARSSLDEFMPSQQLVSERLELLLSTPSLNKLMESQQSASMLVKEFLSINDLESIKSASAMAKEVLSSSYINRDIIIRALDVLNNQDYMVKLSKEDFGDNIDKDVYESFSQQLEEVDSEEEFIKIFMNMSPLFRVIFIFILTSIFTVMLNVSSNLITPKISDILLSNGNDNQQKIRDIKKIPISLDSVITDNLRFITRDNVRLRDNASTKSEILDELALGQIVTVLSKRRNWIEITYEYDDGEVMNGWVFTRYTAKFKN